MCGRSASRGCATGEWGGDASTRCESRLRGRGVLLQREDKSAKEGADAPPVDTTALTAGEGAASWSSLCGRYPVPGKREWRREAYTSSRGEGWCGEGCLSTQLIHPCQRPDRSTSMKDGARTAGRFLLLVMQVGSTASAEASTAFVAAEASTASMAVTWAGARTSTAAATSAAGWARTESQLSI
ncbi:hypothetical protein K438DRAFT_1765004 [Mycena galopus ATCC 62051]|nr:hypothetical protein K438DRAFT_1765004 [Mycena galopus ATCC 62051]